MPIAKQSGASIKPLAMFGVSQTAENIARKGHLKLANQIIVRSIHRVMLYSR